MAEGRAEGALRPQTADRCVPGERHDDGHHDHSLLRYGAYRCVSRTTRRNGGGGRDNVVIFLPCHAVTAATATIPAITTTMTNPAVKTDRLSGTKLLPV